MGEARPRGRNRTRRRLGFVLLWLSLCVPCPFGVLWFLVGPGLPYQDPTLAMVEQQARAEHEADIVVVVGFATAVVLAVSGLILVILDRPHPPGALRR